MDIPAPVQKGRPFLRHFPAMPGIRHYNEKPEWHGETIQACRRRSPARLQARSVHRTEIACSGQKSLHSRHMQHRLLFSGYTPSPFTLTKTPMEQRSTHLWWTRQWRDLLQRSGLTYTSNPTFTAGPTSKKYTFRRYGQAYPRSGKKPRLVVNSCIIYFLRFDISRQDAGIPGTVFFLKSFRPRGVHDNIRVQRIFRLFYYPPVTTCTHPWHPIRA